MRVVRIVLILLGLSICPSFSQEAKRLVRMGYTDFTPYSFNQDGRPAGYSIDLLEALAAEAGWETEYREYDNPGEILEAMRRGEVDIHTTLVPSLERKRLVDFTSTYGTWSISVIVDPDRQDATSLDDASGLRIGFVSGSIAEFLVSEQPSLVPVAVRSTDELILKYLSGDIDGLAYIDDAFRRIALQSGFEDRIRALDPPLSVRKFAAAVSSSAEGLLEETEAAIGALQSSGKLAGIHTDWFAGAADEELIKVANTAKFIAALAVAALLVAAAWFWFSLARRERRDRKLMDEIFEALPVGVTVFDENKRLRFFNKTYSSFFDGLEDRIKRGITYPELIAMSVDAGLHDLEGQDPEDFKAHHIQRYEIGEGESQIRLKNGRTYVSLVRQMSRGWTMGTRRDITADLQKTGELSRIRDRLELVLNTTRNGIVAMNRDGQIVLSNPAANHMLGTGVDQLPCPWPEHVRFLDGLDLRPLEASLDPINRTLAGQALSEETNLMTRRDGTKARYVRVSSSIVNDPAETVRAVIILDDVTEAETARQQIERSNRLDALGQLTGGIAHDFNNLLGTILYAIELTAMEPQSEKVSRILSTAKNSIERGTNLTGRLLAFARRQPGLEKSRSINEVIEELNAIVKPTIEENISFRTKKDDADLWVYCDQAQLDNALLNLILNARDAIARTGRPGTIRVTARGVSDLDHYERALKSTLRSPEKEDTDAGAEASSKPDDDQSLRFVEISVTDDGPGMNDEVKRRAIDPFFSTKDMNTGTGLGLSMVYGFLRQTGGELRIYSEEGHGTTVRMMLPRGTPDGGRESPVERAPIRRGNGEKILLVEDEADLREMMHDMLVTLGYSVIEARNGADALQKAEEHGTFDLLLSDIIMPGGIGGFELAAKLRQMHPALPVIYMSGYTGFNETEMGDAVAPLVTKPCMPAELATVIHRVLNTPVP